MIDLENIKVLLAEITERAVTEGERMRESEAKRAKFEEVLGNIE
jgi:hypothetical protein